MRGGRGRAQQISGGPRGGRSGRSPQRVLMSSSGMSMFESCTGVGCSLVTSDCFIIFERSWLPEQDHYFQPHQRNLRLALLNGFLARSAVSRNHFLSSLLSTPAWVLFSLTILASVPSHLSDRSAHGGITLIIVLIFLVGWPLVFSPH